MMSDWFAGSGFAPRATTLCELLPPLLNRNKGMQLIDSCVSFLEVKVVTIRYARIIAHPLTDFRQALSGNCEKGAERMAHHMRRDPRKILLKFFSDALQIEIERADEIVAVATLTALDFRCDTPRSVHRVAFQESNKGVWLARFKSPANQALVRVCGRLGFPP
jgi:hypothetical protein